MTLRAKKFIGYAAAIAALLAVFALYTRPAMMVALGDMIWACFH